MENIYSVGVENRYQLFLDFDEDPLEVLKLGGQAESKKQTKLIAKVDNSKADKNKFVLPHASRKVIKEIQNLDSLDIGQKSTENFNNKPRVTKYFINDNQTKEGMSNRRMREQDKQTGYHTPSGFSEVQDDESCYKRKNNQGLNHKKESGSDSRNEFGQTITATGLDGDKPNQDDIAGRGGYYNKGRRQFDRLSRSTKTGIKPIAKRDGGGAHNWGSYQDELNEASHSHNQRFDEHQDYSNKRTDELNPGLNDNNESNTSSFIESEKPILQEDQIEMTLDEYKALKGDRQKPMYNLRKANEGEDPSQWKKMYALIKRKEIEEDEEEYEKYEYPQRAGRQKLLLGIKYFFKDRFGSNSRSRRGGSRGGSTRPAAIQENEEICDYDGSYNYDNHLKLDDDKDFPSLG